MPPFLGGGEMISDVFLDHSTYAERPPSRLLTPSLWFNHLQTVVAHLPTPYWTNGMSRVTKRRRSWNTGTEVMHHLLHVKWKFDIFLVRFQGHLLWSLEYLHVNNAVQLGFYREALSYWKNLKGFTCDIRLLEISSLASELRRCCKDIRYLCIRGKLGAKEAIAIVNSLPELRCFSLERSSLTIGALLIFDGHKKLVTLDLQHSIFVGEKYLPSFCHREPGQVQLPLCQGIKAKKWNEDIREKVSGRKTYLRCEEKLCPKCCWGC
ncbi:hypothetical protein IFM89_037240 [Coptis chinensis]|uniref:Uncharacterized protein n=1 Tax=Coptis chinensis TaxID=261450 RepID=A0A835H9Z6_9MAGN|nr:hypothetical protein IFM89_037240 [Coptis chinensis]